MATKDFRQPFYVYGEDQASVCFKHNGERTDIYDCATVDVAVEIASAMNLVFQCITYGMPDPIAKKEFDGKYGGLNYCADDVQEFVGKMMEHGLIPMNFHEFPSHTVN